MKIKWDQQYLKYSLYSFLAIALSIVFYQILDNTGLLLSGVLGFLGSVRRILSPFVVGAFIAFLLNPGVRWFEAKVFVRIKYISKNKKAARNISIISVYFLLIGFIAMVAAFVAPQIGNNIRDILRNVPTYMNATTKFMNQWIEDTGVANIYNLVEYIERNINEIFTQTSKILEYVLDNIVPSILMITSGILNFVLGLIISFYMLSDKDFFKVGVEKFLRAILKEHQVDRIKDFGREVDDTFAKYIVGKFIDSFIIGCMCFVGLIIMNIRYGLLLSVIIGITNMIPYFGPFIGGVPAVIITLFDNPINALWVALFILALQQFDGLILGPKILGDSVGVKPFWIVFSIVVGGKLFGVLGMFLGVPVFAVIRNVTNRVIDRQLERKKQQMHNEV